MVAARCDFGALGQAERRAREADEHAAVVVRGVEDAELQAQREIAEGFLGVVEQPQRTVAVADHLAVEVKHAATAGSGKTSSF